MATAVRLSGNPAVLGVERSITGQAWRWRHSVAEELAPDDLVTQLLLARGCAREDLDRHRAPTIRGFMPDPAIFRDMDVAAARLADAVERGEAVTIFGDYDVDGATSAALLVRLLRGVGLDPQVYIPDRLTEGYGPSAAALTRIASNGAQLIVTVDCGAQAFEALAAAHEAGIEVVVVDHHKCAAELPSAHAIVNPNRLDEVEGAEHGHLAAVGVCFLLGAALLRELRARGRAGLPNLLESLDLVALGTVADVAQLRGLNRAFVAQGLKVLARRGNIGLAALADAARLSRAPTCSDLGFALGPRINAGGRVGASDLGVRLLITEDAAEAQTLARELDRLNEERRTIEAAVQAEADAQVVDASVLVVAGEDWHPGVIGIVAGRLKEKLGRPVIVVAFDEHGVGKGSGRSIAGVDLGQAVLAAKEAGLLLAGGGHAMAAGLTIDAGRVGELAAFLDDRLANKVAAATANRALLLDGIYAPGGVTLELVEAMDAGGPYGVGWPAPRIVAGPVRLVKCDVVGYGHVRAIVAGDDGRGFKGVAFRAADGPLGQALLAAPPHRRLWLAGRLKRDDWGQRPAAELHIEDAAWTD